MNWLAHLHLSEPTPEFCLGSILPDLVKQADLVAMPAEFQPGIRRHVQIDAFTDSHPVFRGSIQRLKPPYRRFGGLLMDVLYDHFLASHWDSFSATPLPDFAAEVYTGFEELENRVPETARLRLQLMRKENWLCSYRDMTEVAVALDRIDKRLRQPANLAESVIVLERDYSAFYNDFSVFYPELRANVVSCSRRQT